MIFSGKPYVHPDWVQAAYRENMEPAPLTGEIIPPEPKAKEQKAQKQPVTITLTAYRRV